MGWEDPSVVYRMANDPDTLRPHILQYHARVSRAAPHSAGIPIQEEQVRTVSHRTWALGHMLKRSDEGALFANVMLSECIAFGRHATTGTRFGEQERELAKGSLRKIHAEKPR